MIRLLNVYYPTRNLVLFLCEAILIGGAFLLATAFRVGIDTYIALVYQDGMLKIGAICAFILLLSYYFDLYEPQRISGHWEVHFRLLLVLSTLCFTLAALVYFFPSAEIGPNVLVTGAVIVSVVLVVWRSAYPWIIDLPIFQERVYVLGSGERARSIASLIRSRKDVGMTVIEGQCNTAESQAEQFVADLRAFGMRRPGIDRIIVTLEDRRGSMPVQELLDLRLQGVVIEEYNSVIERLAGRIPLNGLNPSTMIFTQGFNLRPLTHFIRRIVSIIISGAALAICLPFLPFVMLAVRLSSAGPIFFRQIRVGRNGRPFTLYKFRSMRQDAEANGAQWATKNDSRITPVGAFMRKTRIDEIPQLFNVLRGDMGFVGPRPERPEFVEWLIRDIPYYNLRHIIRPGITGWAQVRYQYGASLDETKRKLEYDLYYIKHISLGLDLLIIFETVKTILLRRGAQ